MKLKIVIKVAYFEQIEWIYSLLQWRTLTTKISINDNVLQWQQAMMLLQWQHQWWWCEQQTMMLWLIDSTTLIALHNNDAMMATIQLTMETILLQTMTLQWQQQWHYNKWQCHDVTTNNDGTMTATTMTLWWSLTLQWMMIPWWTMTLLWMEPWWQQMHYNSNNNNDGITMNDNAMMQWCYNKWWHYGSHNNEATIGDDAMMHANKKAMMITDATLNDSTVTNNSAMMRLWHYDNNNAMRWKQHQWKTPLKTINIRSHASPLLQKTTINLCGMAATQVEAAAAEGETINLCERISKSITCTEHLPTIAINKDNNKPVWWLPSSWKPLEWKMDKNTWQCKPTTAKIKIQQSNVPNKLFSKNA